MEKRLRKRWITAVIAALTVIAVSMAIRATRQALAELPVGRSDVTQPVYVGKLRFLALGDSYTIGEQVTPPEGWPMQLARHARAAGIDLSDPLIIARTGWTTGDLLRAVDQNKPDSNYDLVMLLIGVNNQFQHRSTIEYRQEFSELLERSMFAAKGKANHVLVLSIPDWGMMPFAAGSDRAAIGSQIDSFNQIASQECENAHVKYLDITPLSRLAATQPTLIADDGLHPSGRQYAKWAELARPQILRLFNTVPQHP